MKNRSYNLPQDQPAVYRVEVNGSVDGWRQGWFEDMAVSTERSADEQPISTLVGSVADQAALHGLLSRLYTLGLRVISVTRVE